MDLYGVTAFMTAVKMNFAGGILAFMNDSRVDLNHQNKLDSSTALHYASLEGHSHIVRLLLDQSNIDATLRDINGLTAYLAACKHNQTRTVHPYSIDIFQVQYPLCLTPTPASIPLLMTKTVIVTTVKHGC